jgi:hypothetical protein
MGQAGDTSLFAETILEKIHEIQEASLGLFKKVRHSVYTLGRSTVDKSFQMYEERSAENKHVRGPAV